MARRKALILSLSKDARRKSGSYWITPRSL